MKTKLKLSHTYPPLLRFLRSRYSRKLPLLALLGITPGLQAQTWTAPATAQTNATKKAEVQKAVRHEVSVSADYLYGLGHVGVPFNFTGVLPLNVVPAEVLKPERKSSFFGGSLSYSVSQAWYVDASYAQGNSSGQLLLPVLDEAAQYTVDETTFQGYVRYNFPGLRGKRFGAYMRLGVTYSQADLLVDSIALADTGAGYSQQDKTQDLLGNLGFGLGYTLFTGPRARLALQLEAEAFAGQRTQKLNEQMFSGPGLLPNDEAATVDNLLVGGIGRFTLRYQHRFGETGRLRAFADIGVQGKYTTINYKDLGSSNELLWGPYTRIGFGYSF
jgi:hypothetical protein